MVFGITSGVRSELRTLLNAVVNARLVEDRAHGELTLAQERASLETRLMQDRAHVEARFAQERVRIDARLAQARANAQARVSQAEKKLSKAIAQRIERALPTSDSGNVWWIDPILGLREQINFTRWFPGRAGRRGRVRCQVADRLECPGYLGSQLHSQHLRGARLSLYVRQLR